MGVLGAPIPPLPSSTSARAASRTLPTAMVWEFVFMMVILKIPIAYLGCVVYWAVKAEPKPPEPAVVHAGLPEPEPREPWRPRGRTSRPGPHGSPGRRVARAARSVAR